MVVFYDPKALRQIGAKLLNQVTRIEIPKPKIRAATSEERDPKKDAHLELGQKLKFYWSISVRGHANRTFLAEQKEFARMSP